MYCFSFKCFPSILQLTGTLISLWFSSVKMFQIEFSCLCWPLQPSVPVLLNPLGDIANILWVDSYNSWRRWKQKQKPQNLGHSSLIILFCFWIYFLPIVSQCGRKRKNNVGAEGVMWVCAIQKRLIREKIVDFSYKTKIETLNKRWLILLQWKYIF